MVRQIINIDRELCIGCGLCIGACQEGAIGLVDGKATLLRDDYCDGLGNCLPVCPTGAISFEEREAMAFDKEAVKEKEEKKTLPVTKTDHTERITSLQKRARKGATLEGETDSELRQWPVQIKLVPVQAGFFDGANLLVAADCTAYAYANFHRDFIRGHVTLIGCPKLDDANYQQKLTAILKNNNIKSFKIVRMEVPCCGGLERAAVQALKDSGKFIPWQVVTITTDGGIKDI